MKKDKYFIPRDREQMFSPGYWNVIYQTSPKTKKLYGFVLDIALMYFHSGRIELILLKDDWSEKGEYFANRFFDDKYFNKIKDKFSEETKKTKEFLKRNKEKNLSRLSFEELIKLADKVKKTCLDYDTANVLAWFLGGDKFQEKIFEIINIPKQDFLFLVTPKEKTAVSELEYKLLKYPLVKKDIKKASKELSRDYGWIPFGYDGPKYWDENYFEKELEKNLKNIKRIKETVSLIERKDKEKLLKRRKLEKKLNKKQLNLIKKSNELALWTDERKKHTFQLYYCYSRVLWEVEKRYNLSYKNLKYLFTEELKDISEKKDYILRISNERIKNDFMIKAKNGKIKILLRKEKDRILKEVKKQTEVTSIKGIVACRGPKEKYNAKVKIVLSPEQASKIQKGDFLVANMTSPDYVMAMKKAAGFITDEGGVTCHAAIVAREMNKPCVIGAKIATKVLKDNDFVKIDINEGSLKVIKRAR